MKHTDKTKITGLILVILTISILGILFSVSSSTKYTGNFIYEKEFMHTELSSYTYKYDSKLDGLIILNIKDFNKEDTLEIYIDGAIVKSFNIKQLLDVLNIKTEYSNRKYILKDAIYIPIEKLDIKIYEKEGNHTFKAIIFEKNLINIEYFKI